METVHTQLVQAITARLATRNVAEHAVYSVANTLARADSGSDLVDVDLGEAGIRTDHIVHDQGDLLDFLKQLGSGPNIASIQIIPKGVLAPSHYLVKIEHFAQR